MEINYKPSFVRDVKKAAVDAQISLRDVIDKLKSVDGLNKINNLKKLKGHKTAYRIKINTFRLCFYYNNDNVLELARFLPRKDVYRFFP